MNTKEKSVVVTLREPSMRYGLPLLALRIDPNQQIIELLQSEEFPGQILDGFPVSRRQAERVFKKQGIRGISLVD